MWPCGPVANRRYSRPPVCAAGFERTCAERASLCGWQDRRTRVHGMKTNRRRFLKSSALGAGVIGLFPALAAEKPSPASFLTGRPKMKLGTVTYNLAQDWDIETIIKNCEA